MILTPQDNILPITQMNLSLFLAGLAVLISEMKVTDLKNLESNSFFVH